MRATSERVVSLAHLSMISVPPVDLVMAAAEAGFDAVGLRLVPTSHGIDHRVLGNAAALRNLRRAVDDSGLDVLDVEVVRVRQPEHMDDPAALIEAAAALGARYIITTVEDDDEQRRVDTFGRLCEQAAVAGVGISLEFMVFSAVPTLGAAVDLLSRVGALNAVVLVDALHHERGGGRPEELAALPERLVPYLQVCDAVTSGAQPEKLAARAEAVTARLLPGDGVLPLAALVAAVPSSAALSIESPLAWPDTTTDPVAAARRARAAVEPLLA